MRCAWKELLAILPPWLRQEVDTGERDKLQEIRLRIKAPPELVIAGKSKWLSRCVTREDLNFCVNTASRYSPWSAVTAAQGFITAPGGHRIGLCGEAICKDGEMAGIRTVMSLCIRIARDYPGIGDKLKHLEGSILILGAPGWGKTTLLRDLIRQRSDGEIQTSVVDERGELFPGCVFPTGKRTDVLTGCAKAAGIEMLLRTMGPQCIAVDEITAEADCQAMLRAAWCGVSLLATAHAASIADFHSRPVYRVLAETGIFQYIVLLHQDKSWHLERSGQWTTNGSGRY